MSSLSRYLCIFLIVMAAIWKGRSALRLPSVSTRAAPVSNKSVVSKGQDASQKPLQTSKFNIFNLFRGRNKAIVTQVVTDVDDTIVSSGGLKLFGVTLGGVDTQYPRGQFYPGAVQFALELSLSGDSLKHKHPLHVFRRNNQTQSHSTHKHATHTTHGHSHTPPISKVAVLTARARELKLFLALRPRGKLDRAYQQAGESLGLGDWGLGEVHYGSVREWILQHEKGQRKFRNFEQMILRDAAAPNKRFVLIGDTGERDEEAGRRVALAYPRKLQAIFMHVVYPLQAARSAPADTAVNGVPLLYFRTYLGAAVKAYQHRLISAEGVRRVAQRSVAMLRDSDAREERRLALLRKGAGAWGRGMLDKIQERQRGRWQELYKDAAQVSFLRDVAQEITKHV